MDTAGVVATYGAAWNEPDAEKRRALLEQAWTDDGTYCDPMGRADGRAALVDHIGEFIANMAGHTIDMTSGVDEHDGSFRFAWVMRNADGVALEGIDYGEIASDGRISKIVGFFGPFPALDA